jgi:hypothetical protein
VKKTPHAARGNNAQIRGKLQIADVTEQRANEKQAAALKHLEIKIQF